MLICDSRRENTPLSLIVNIDVPDSVILSRISNRWVHLPSGRVYNMNYNRPQVDGLDDETGEKLVQRPDDNPVRQHVTLLRFVALNVLLTPQETFSRRLSKFYSTTSPLLMYFASRSPSVNFASLKGNTSDTIWPQLEAVVKRSFPTLKERDITKRMHNIGDTLVNCKKGERQKIDS